MITIDRRVGRRHRPASLWALVAALAAGCSVSVESGAPTPAGNNSTATAKPGSASGPRFIFVTNSNSDWWTAVETGMNDAGRELGCQVELRRNERETTGQIKILEDVLSIPDVKGVAVSVYEADAPGIVDKLRELKQAGKIVITIDSDLDPTKYDDAREAYIGTDNRKAGEAAGKAAAAIRPEGGNVCVFVGTSSAANAVQRREGFFAGAGDKFVQQEVFDDGSSFTKAASNVQTAISKHPDLGVLLGLWSYNAPRIADEVASSPDVRKKVSVVTFDLDELAVGHIEQGNIDVSVCQNPYEMGFQGVRLLKALLEKDEAAIRDVLPDGKTRDTGVRVIVRDEKSPVKGDNVITIEKMKEWLASKGLKAS